MSKRKTYREGEIAVNKQGLNIRLTKYINNKKCEVQIMETGEKKMVRYSTFKKGAVVADLLKYPMNNDCSLIQAISVSLAILTIIGVAIVAFIYQFAK